jgi:hypothetical protein
LTQSQLLITSSHLPFPHHPPRKIGHLDDGRARRDRTGPQVVIADVKKALRLSGMRPVPRWPARTSVDLRGKRILLTGASAGIGEVAAQKLADHGATVIAVARRESLLADLVERITARGGNAIAIPTDLADLAQVDKVVEAVGPVDILINNAARSIRRPLIESLDRWHDVERVMALNYYAPLRLIRGLAPAMIERGDGHIINVAPGASCRSHRRCSLPTTHPRQR